MARVMVLYKTPKDKAAFDKYYFETHVPIAQKIPGLKKFEVSQGAVTSRAGDPGIHRIAILHFDTMAALQAGLGSSEGKAATADVAKFAPERDAVEMLMFETRQV